MSALHRGYHKFALHPEKKAWFLRFSRSLLIIKLFVNLESGKINCCFGNSLEKVLNILDPKFCTYPVYTSDPAEGTTLPLGLGEAFVPNPGKIIIEQ